MRKGDTLKLYRVDGDLHAEVEVRRLFEVFGLTFAVHRHPDEDKGFQVSEVSSGAAVTQTWKAYGTQKAAESAARERLDHFGEETTRKAIARGHDAIRVGCSPVLK